MGCAGHGASPLLLRRRPLRARCIGRRRDPARPQPGAASGASMPRRAATIKYTTLRPPCVVVAVVGPADAAGTLRARGRGTRRRVPGCSSVPGCSRFPCRAAAGRRGPRGVGHRAQAAQQLAALAGRRDGAWRRRGRPPRPAAWTRSRPPPSADRASRSVMILGGIWWRSGRSMRSTAPVSPAKDRQLGSATCRGMAGRLDHLSAPAASRTSVAVPVCRVAAKRQRLRHRRLPGRRPVFGTSRRLRRAARRQCTERGMKLVMDLVVNQRAPPTAPMIEESRARLTAAAEAVVLVGPAAVSSLELVALGAWEPDPRRASTLLLCGPQAARPSTGEPGGPRGDLLDDARW